MSVVHNLVTMKDTLDEVCDDLDEVYDIFETLREEIKDKESDVYKKIVKAQNIVNHVLNRMEE